MSDLSSASARHPLPHARRRARLKLSAQCQTSHREPNEERPHTFHAREAGGFPSKHNRKDRGTHAPMRRVRNGGFRALMGCATRLLQNTRPPDSRCQSPPGADGAWLDPGATGGTGRSQSEDVAEDRGGRHHHSRHHPRAPARGAGLRLEAAARMNRHYFQESEREIGVTNSWGPAAAATVRIQFRKAGPADRYPALWVCDCATNSGSSHSQYCLRVAVLISISRPWVRSRYS